MTKIIYTNKTIKVRWLWIKNKIKQTKSQSVHSFRIVQHLGNSLNNNSKTYTHKNPHSKKNSLN